MWSIFSRDPAKDFAYVIGEKTAGLEEKSVWSLHHGKKKATGEPVSVFVFDVKNSSESQIGLAKASFKRIKTLRHPNILTFLDGIETDKVIYIATEPVTPLETYLQNNEATEKQNQLAIAWGLHKVTKGLSFLVNDCNLIHNNVCMSSIFVDQAGEWKLGGVDYMYPATGQDSVPPVKILPYLERYDPPEKSELRRGIKGEKWSSDMWGLGCLIWEVFNGPLPRTSSLKAFGKIPKPLVPNYCELVSANPSSRPNPAKFIQDCCRQGGFMINPFVKTMLFLEEIQIKDQSEKGKFFNNLTNALDSFPEQLSKHKVLPQLIHAFEFGNAGSAVLAPLFKVGKLLDAEEYQSKIVPCVVKLFSSTDRTTRVKLLQQIELFVEHLQAQTVNEKIFPNIVSGFMDTNPVVRESTIKAMLHLAPKLNYKNLNEELMKHFARLQSKDDQGGIRTNTTVCLGKIAAYLYPQMRQRILCSAFLRAIKDPFPPARQSGIIGLAITQHLFTLADLCHKLMPPLCAMLMDPEKTVRDQAFKTLRSFIERLEKLSEDPELREEMEKDVLTGGTAMTGAAGWAGWAMGGVSSLTSKVYSKATRGKAAPGQETRMTGSATTQKPSQPDTVPPVSGGTTEEQPDEPPDTGQEEEEEEGWDDEDWGDIDTVQTMTTTIDSSNEPSHTNATDGWDNDDDDWGSLEDTSPAHKGQSNSTGRNKPQQSSHTSKSSDDWGWGTEPDTSTHKSHTDSSDKSHKGALRLGGGPKKAPVDDFSWIEEEFAPVEDTSVEPASSYNWGQSDNMAGDDFFSMAGISSQKLKPKPNKLSSTQARSSPARSTPSRDSPARTLPTSSQDPGGGGTEESGWGDTGGWEVDSWDDLNSAKQSEAERKKKEREEKRQQRQQELSQRREARKGGAMKLGAKKLAAD